MSMNWQWELRKQIKVGNRYTKLSRYIMSQHLGRELLPTEFVHHKDGDYNNDAIENLELMSQAEHISYHRNKRDVQPGYFKRIVSDNPNEAWCSKCKKFYTKDKFPRSPGRWNGVCSYCKECQNARRRKRGATYGNKGTEVRDGGGTTETETNTSG